MQSVDKLDYQTCLDIARRLDATKKSGLSEVAIDAIADYVYRKGEQDLYSLNKLIETLIESSQKEEIEPSDLDKPIELISMFLTDQIMTWIEDIREEIFQSRIAPFPSIEEASVWYEEQKKVEREMARRKPKSKYPFLEYENRKKRGDLPPADLCGVRAHEITEATGLEYWSVIYCILANTNPVLRKVEVHIPIVPIESHRLPSGVRLINRTVSLKIRAPLSFGELYELHQHIRRQLGIRRSKSLNKRHLELYQVVKQKGIPPKVKGTVAFWESVRKEWNNGHANAPYNHWKCVKMAYDRFERKLTGQYLVSEEEYNRQIDEILIAAGLGAHVEK